LSERIAEGVAGASQLYHRLLLVVGPPRTGKTTALLDIRKREGWPLVNINLTLSERLLDLTTRQRALRVARMLDEVAAETDGDVVLLDNTEVLFNAELKQDPLRLLQGLARNRTIVASWAGDYSSEILSYAKPAHPEYKRYRNPDAIIVPIAVVRDVPTPSGNEDPR